MCVLPSPPIRFRTRRFDVQSLVTGRWTTNENQFPACNMPGAGRSRLLWPDRHWHPASAKTGRRHAINLGGKPFLALGGELGNNTATSLENMQPIWPKLVSGNLNCVLVAISWAQMEPTEGKYEFALVDGLIQEARRNNMKIVFLWFGSWKNGLSSYAPYWVKQDYKRFPRIQIKGGKSLELLSAFGDATRDADARAYRALRSEEHTSEL